MIRRHATVLTILFVLLGLMFFSGTTLFVHRDIETVIHESPNAVEQIADEPVPIEPLRMNVLSNPSFETWDSGAPSEWPSDASAYAYSDPTYSGSQKMGSYAGYVAAMGSSQGGGDAFLRNVPVTSPDFPFLRYGVSMTLNWNTLANPDLNEYAYVYIDFELRNFTGYVRHLFYFVSHRLLSFSNSSTYGYIYMNDTIGSWHSFNRNITADYQEVFGSEDMSDTHYVNDFNFHAVTPTDAAGIIEAVVDDVSLYNATYSSWMINGNFELGTGSAWNYYNSNMGHLSQSTDSVDGVYSFNASITATVTGGAWVRVNKYYQGFNTFFALGHGMNTISWDWKYSDTIGAGISQYSYLRFVFYNGTNYYLELYMGRGEDYMTGNTTTTARIAIPGFGTRDSWVHSEMDLYDIMQEVGFYDLRLSSIRFETNMYTSLPDANIQLLVDNFNMVTHPMANPSFEYVDPYGYYSPFQGWWRYSGNGDVTPSHTKHTGGYSANITVENAEDGVYRHDIKFYFDASLYIDFWWRLEDLPGSGEAVAWFNFEFIVGGGNRHIFYVLGISPDYSIENTTTHKYIYVDGCNQTSTWTLLSRNVTADIENAFSVSADDWETYQVTAYAYADIGLRTSLLVDDLHLKDMMPPSVDSVSFDATPMYYADNYVQIYASDDRPGVSNIAVVYSTDNWGSADVTWAAYDVGGWFNATIPAQVYDTDVEFYIQVVDGCGNVALDRNGGGYYTYTVGDDVDPILSIVNPTNNSEVEGYLTINATAEDLGAGIEYVEFNTDGSGAIQDYTYPYSQNWDLDDEALGAHFVIVKARDNAGNTVTKTHYFTLVDTIDPVLDSPEDVEFTVGETGFSIIWSPTDIRPASYDVLIEGVSTYTGPWNDSAENIFVNLDGLSVGTYNYTCVVTDGGGNTAVDTVIVTVNDMVITTTTTTATSTTTTSSTTTTQTVITTSTSTTTEITETTTTTSTLTTPVTSSTPSTTPIPEDQTMLLIGVGVAILGIVIVVVLVMRMRKK